MSEVFGSVWGIGLLVVACIGLCTWFYLRYLRIRYKDYIAHVTQCGNLDAPTPKGLRWFARLTGFYAWLHVGKITVIGKEKLDKLDGKAYVVTPNHGNMNDVVVLPMVMLGKGERYFATDDLFKMAGGLGALIFGPMGVIPVTLAKGKGGAAREAGINLLGQGGKLVLFPEGYSYCDGSMGVFKKGAVAIAAEAAKRRGETTYVVPVYLRYGRYPGHWIRKFRIELQYMICFAFWPLWRAGCTVVIGDPIPSDKLPVDADGMVGEAATDLLKREVCKLDPAGLADADAPPATH